MSVNNNCSKHDSHLLITQSVSPKKTLTEEKANKLFKLYQQFLQRAERLDKVDNFDDFITFLSKNFTTVGECQYAWKDLDVSLSISKIARVLSETNILQLRPISSNAKVLVIGCENCLLVDAGGYPLAVDDDYVDYEEDQNYKKAHQHKNAITINPALAFNPTIVGFFGEQEFPMLQDGQFDLIVIESIQFPKKQQGQNELKRLLAPNGKIVFTTGDKRGFKFSWEELHKNVWTDDYVSPAAEIDDLNAYEEFKRLYAIFPDPTDKTMNIALDSDEAYSGFANDAPIFDSESDLLGKGINAEDPFDPTPYKDLRLDDYQGPLFQTETKILRK